MTSGTILTTSNGSPNLRILVFGKNNFFHFYEPKKLSFFHFEGPPKFFLAPKPILALKLMVLGGLSFLHFLI